MTSTLKSVAFERLRTLAVLSFLGMLLVVGVTFGFAQVAKPFPQREDAPICVDTEFAVGDILRPAAITVSVLNGGERDGLASSTAEDLEEQGFARGQLSNAPSDSTVASAEIWTSDRQNPVVQLVRSYLGGRVKIVDRAAPSVGINIVVGDQFPGVRQGREEIAVQQSGSVCSPPALS